MSFSSLSVVGGSQGDVGGSRFWASVSWPADRGGETPARMQGIDRRQVGQIQDEEYCLIDFN